jgi:Glycosyltransferase family 87
MPIPARRAILAAFILVGILLLALDLTIIGAGNAADAHAYFAATGADPYGQSAVGEADAYLYSPAFAQALEPIRWLGWDAFRQIWRTVEVGSLVVLAGPFAAAMPFMPAVAFEINLGNVQLLLALAIVAGFRWPAAWAFVLLTKVTPGIGLLWFAVRREWRSLGIALGTTAAIALVSFAFAPDAWSGWLNALLRAVPPPSSSPELIPLPLAVRLVIAAAITIWAARTNRRWGVVVAAFLAMPLTWTSSASILVGLLALLPPWGWMRDQVATAVSGDSASLSPGATTA